jgi:agmatinase
MSTLDPIAVATMDEPSGEGVFGLPHGPGEAAAWLVPVPFQATVSYGEGTMNGPAAILAASHQLDLHDAEVGEPWKQGIAMLPESNDVRAWSRDAREAVRRALDTRDPSAVVVVDSLCERVNEHLRAQVEAGLQAGKLVGTIGGDHGAVFGAIEAHSAHYPGLGILQLDAHADLRRAYQGFAWSHASIMDNVLERLDTVARIVQVGVRDLCAAERRRIEDSAGRVRTHFDAVLARERFEGASFAGQAERIVEDLPAQVYVSFDVDGLDPALCPHTGTPVPGGLSFQQACYLLGAVARSGRRIVGFDLVEVAPGPPGDEWDANVGARLIYKLIGFASLSRSGDRRSATSDRVAST